MAKVRRIAKKYAKKRNETGGFYFKGGEYFEYKPFFDRITIARSVFIKTNTERTTRRCHFIVIASRNLDKKINYMYVGGDYSTIYSLQDMQKKVIHHPNINTFMRSVNFE